MTQLKEQAQDKDLVDVASTELYKVLKPMFAQLQVFGLYFPSRHMFPREDHEMGAHAWTCTTGRRCIRTGRAMWKAYSLMVVVALWLHFARLLSMFAGKEEFDRILFSKMLSIAFTAMANVSALMLFLACHMKRSGFAKFISQWQHLQDRHEPGSLKYLTIHVTLFSLVVLVLVIFNTAFVAYGMYTDNMFDILIAPMSPEDPYAPWYQAIYLIAHTYMTAAWGYAMAMLVLHCLVLKQEFSIFNKEFKIAFGRQQRGEPFRGDIERFRSWHHEICDVAAKADDIFTLQIATVFVATIVQICIIMYLLIYHLAIWADVLLVTMNMVWLLGASGALMSTCVYSAMVNHSAHSVYDDIHNMSLEGISQESAFQMSVFLNRLSGSRIGLTALKMFVIDKPTILTMVGMLITYFVLMLQFAPTSPTGVSTAGCNCSAMIINDSLTCYHHN